MDSFPGVSNYLFSKPLMGLSSLDPRRKGCMAFQVVGVWQNSLVNRLAKRWTIRLEDTKNIKFIQVQCETDFVTSKLVSLCHVHTKKYHPAMRCARSINAFILNLVELLLRAKFGKNPVHMAEYLMLHRLLRSHLLSGFPLEILPIKQYYFAHNSHTPLTLFSSKKKDLGSHLPSKP